LGAAGALGAGGAALGGSGAFGGAGATAAAAGCDSLTAPQQATGSQACGQHERNRANKPQWRFFGQQVSQAGVQAQGFAHSQTLHGAQAAGAQGAQAAGAHGAQAAGLQGAQAAGAHGAQAAGAQAGLQGAQAAGAQGAQAAGSQLRTWQERSRANRPQRFGAQVSQAGAQHFTAAQGWQAAGAHGWRAAGAQGWQAAGLQGSQTLQGSHGCGLQLCTRRQNIRQRFGAQVSQAGAQGAGAQAAGAQAAGAQAHGPAVALSPPIRAMPSTASKIAMPQT
jgi:hypothetical protein